MVSPVDDFLYFVYNPETGGRGTFWEAASGYEDWQAAEQTKTHHELVGKLLSAWRNLGRKAVGRNKTHLESDVQMFPANCKPEVVIRITRIVLRWRSPGIFLVNGCRMAKWSFFSPIATVRGAWINRGWIKPQPSGFNWPGFQGLGCGEPGRLLDLYGPAQVKRLTPPPPYALCACRLLADHRIRCWRDGAPAAWLVRVLRRYFVRLQRGRIRNQKQLVFSSGLDPARGGGKSSSVLPPPPRAWIRSNYPVMARASTHAVRLLRGANPNPAVGSAGAPRPLQCQGFMASDIIHSGQPTAEPCSVCSQCRSRGHDPLRGFGPRGGVVCRQRFPIIDYPARAIPSPAGRHLAVFALSD